MTRDVQSLFLQVDASVELLRRNLAAGEQPLTQFEQRAAKVSMSVEKSIGAMGKNFGVFSQLAQTAAQQAEKSFNDSFTQIQRMAAKAISAPQVKGGGLNLGAAEARQAADAAHQQAQALALIEKAARSAAAGTGVMTQDKRVMGLGAPIELIDVAAFVEGAAIADLENWTLGGVVYSRPDTPWNNLKLMLQAGSAVPVAVGGTISCVVDTPRVSLATIKDGDIVGECSLATTAPRRARINGVVPRYRSEAHDWSIVAAELVQVPEYVTQDDGERTKEIEFPLVQNVRQASVLSAYHIANARELGPGTFPLKPAWMNFRIGDCVTISTREIPNMKVLILERAIEPSSGVVTYTVRSETDAKHAFALGQVGVAPPTASLPDYEAVDTAPSPGAWTLSATLVSSAPALVVTGSVEDGNTEAVVFDYRVWNAAAGDEDGWISAGLEANTLTRKEITGIARGVLYEVSVRYRVQGAAGARLILGPVSIAKDVPTATALTVNTSSALPVVKWKMPDITGWSYVHVYRGTSSLAGDGTAVSGAISGGLFEGMTFEDVALPSGTYWWWVRVYDATNALVSTSDAVSATVF